MNIVEMKNVTKIYGEKENQVLALQNINQYNSYQVFQI